MTTSSDNGGIPRRKAVQFLPGGLQMVAASGSTPGPSSSSSPSGNTAQPSGTSHSSHPPHHVSAAPSSDPLSSLLLPGDPMDTTPDYEGFGHLGSPQAAFVYQRIIFPAICAAFGPPMMSEVPAYAFYPPPFVVPVAFRAAVVPPSTFITPSVAAASTSTSTSRASSYRARY